MGLGPSAADLLTVAARTAIEKSPEERRFCRTARHPCIAELAAAGITFTSFDDIYETAETIEEVYSTIVARLLAEGDVLYAVPGSPSVGESTVTALRAATEVEVIEGVSFIDRVATLVGADPVVDGLTILDAERFDLQSRGSGPLLIAQCHSRALVSEVKLELLDDYPDDFEVGVVTGGSDEVEWTPLAEVDHHEPTPLTSLFVPAHPDATSLPAFIDLVAVLRDGCPWDREQTHQTLTRHLLEETYEVLEAIEGLPDDEVDLDAYAKLEEELGDLLFQVVFHATLAKEAGAFTFGDVARGIHAKLVNRHPHVFGEVEVSGADEVVTNWEAIKSVEKGRASLMDDIPRTLPGLLYANKIQRRAASIGFDWDEYAPVLGKVREELGELEDAIGDADELPTAEVEGELGDLLFAVVNLARKIRVDPEGAVRGASDRFGARFRLIERAAVERGLDLNAMSLGELDELWDEAKARLAASAGNASASA